MPTTVIGDSNLYYDLADKRITVGDIVHAGEQLHYSPVTVIEITSKLSEKTFKRRKAAAQAILDSGAIELPDPQSFLTTTFGYELVAPPFDWSQALIALSQSPDLAALEKGVDDHAARVRRRVVVSEALHWRETTYELWQEDMIALMKEKIPKFEKWYGQDPATRKKQVPKIKKKDQDEILKELTSEPLLTELIVACQTRSFRGAVPPADVENPPQELVNALHEAIGKIRCYCDVYIQYVVRLLTEEMLPKPNDSGDLELFLYAIDDDHVVVTSDKKWVELGKKAGYKHRVRQV